MYFSFSFFLRAEASAAAENLVLLLARLLQRDAEVLAPDMLNPANPNHGD